MLHGYIEKIAPNFVHGWAADTEQPDSMIDAAMRGQAIHQSVVQF